MFLSSRPDNKKRERFLIIQPKHDLIGYFVQCLFNGATTEMLCEAASGFYSAKAGQPRKWQLSSDALDRLAVYGFERDSAAGNHRQIFKLNARPISHVTDMMLGALHDAYGVRIETPLEFKAPLADKFGFSPSCKPNS